MSLEIFDDEVKRKHLSAGGGTSSGKSVHEHAGNQLLYPYTVTIEENPDGSTTSRKEIDVDARTELPAPANTAVLEWYAGYLDKAFGKGRGLGMRTINERYKINMISKNRKGRNEYTMIATASGLNPQTTDSNDLLKKVQES